MRVPTTVEISRVLGYPTGWFRALYRIWSDKDVQYIDQIVEEASSPLAIAILATEAFGLESIAISIWTRWEIADKRERQWAAAQLKALQNEATEDQALKPLTPPAQNSELKPMPSPATQVSPRTEYSPRSKKMRIQTYTKNLGRNE